MEKASVLDKARTYQDIINTAKSTYLKTVYNGRSIHNVHDKVQLPLGFIWLALKLLEQDRIVEALNQLNKAKVEVVGFVKWVSSQIQQDGKIIFLSQKVI